MTDAINSNNRIKPQGPATDSRAKSNSNGPAESASAASSSAVVNLSSDQVLDQIDRVPEVNSSRIESIKTALANGEYKPDPEVIAKKFAEIENLLP